MESKEVMEHLGFMIRTCRDAARSVKQRLLPAIEEAYRELVRMVEQRYEEEKAGMFKRKVTTILPPPPDTGMICSACPLKGQGMNQMQFCSFYKRSHDSNKPSFCKVERIEITERPAKLYNKNNEPVDSGCPGNEGKG